MKPPIEVIKNFSIEEMQQALLQFGTEVANSPDAVKVWEEKIEEFKTSSLAISLLMTILALPSPQTVIMSSVLQAFMAGVHLGESRAKENSNAEICEVCKFEKDSLGCLCTAKA